MTRVDSPPEPLARFQSIYHELNSRRRWHQGPAPLRYAAVALMTSAGEPYMVADRVYTVAEGLKSRAGWFGSMRSGVRFVVAANLVRNGDSPRRFSDDVDRISDVFRRHGLRSGSVYEVLAILILRGAPGERRVGDAEIARFQKIYEMMKTHHWWLTGPDDYAACALLARTRDSVGEMARRIEILYRGLRAAGLPAGDQLQLASHVLYFNPASDHIVQKRFLRLREGFRAAGVRIWQSDFDELAVLSFLDDAVDTIVRRVVRLRAKMKKLKPAVDYNESFSLACAVTFVEQLRASHDVHQMQTLMQLQSILAAQQASMVAVTAAS